MLGRKFRLETDHRTLAWLGHMRDKNARITRWFLPMQPFDFEVLYRSGSQNCTAEFISRIPQAVSEEGGGNVTVRLCDYNPKSEKVGTVWKMQIRKESSDF